MGYLLNVSEIGDRAAGSRGHANIIGLTTRVALVPACLLLIGIPHFEIILVTFRAFDSARWALSEMTETAGPLTSLRSSGVVVNVERWASQLTISNIDLPGHHNGSLPLWWWRHVEGEIV